MIFILRHAEVVGRGMNSLTESAQRFVSGPLVELVKKLKIDLLYCHKLNDCLLEEQRCYRTLSHLDADPILLDTLTPEFWRSVVRDGDSQHVGVCCGIRGIDLAGEVILGSDTALHPKWISDIDADNQEAYRSAYLYSNLITLAKKDGSWEVSFSPLGQELDRYGCLTEEIARREAEAGSDQTATNDWVLE